MNHRAEIKSTEFKNDIKKAIKFIGNLNESVDNETLLTLLIQNGIKENHAIEIVYFLPIAFVRKMLPNVNWHKEYIEQSIDKVQKTKSYTGNEFYRVIEEVTESYYKENPESDVMIKIAGRSAEFKVISELLLKDENADISEIKLTETFIIRNY